MIHFDMNLEDFKGKEGFNQIRNNECTDHNRKVVARYKQLYLNTQPQYMQPLITSSRKETPLEKEYPYTVPSTNSKIDNNSNIYFTISKFSLFEIPFFRPRK